MGDALIGRFDFREVGVRTRTLLLTLKLGYYGGFMGVGAMISLSYFLVVLAWSFSAEEFRGPAQPLERLDFI